MKRIVCIVWTGVLLYMTGCKSEEYTLDGNIGNNHSATIKITTLGVDGQEETVASCETTDGTFHFSGHITPPRICFLTASGINGRIPLLLENKHYRVTIVSDQITDCRDFTVEGGRLQAIRNKIHVEESAFYGYRDSLVNLYQQARTVMDVIEMSIIRKKLDSLSEQYNTCIQEHIRANNDNLVGLSLVYEHLKQLSYKQLKARYELLSAPMQNTPEGETALRRLNRLGSMQIGGQFLDFRLPSVTGDTIVLSGLKGKVKLIDFWASWCGPCRSENPNLLRIYEKYKDKGLVIVAISMDTQREAWLKAIEEDKLPWLQLSDLKGMRGHIARQYNIQGIPQTYLLDEENKVIAVGLRGKALEETVDKVMR